jgi:hypothetical protein
VSPRPGGINVSLSSHTTAQTPGIPTGFSTQQRVGADGRFSIDGVPPGHYTLLASSWIPPASPDGSPVVLSASTDFALNGEDISGVVLTLTPGIRLAGRVAFDGQEPSAADLAALTVNLPLTPTTPGVRVSIPPLQIGSGGRFVLEGLAPGTYRPGATVRGLRAPLGRWWLKSMVIEGRETLDGTLDLRQNTDGAVVTLSERASTLTGIVRDARGELVRDVWVVVFTTHPAGWFHDSRRVAAVKTDRDGRYTIRNLPAGEYHLATTFDLDPDQWFDPVLLQQLAAGTMRITIADSEEKTVDPVLR